ncbi:universal stress protein [Microcoleus sp. FACHB-SPT15]|nr:universal stress protein [Microcoleus sp. FACHB-SPT15]
MLVRLEGAMDRNDLIEQMVLLPEPASAAAKWSNSTKSVNLVVGYNASPSSQTALDLTMWIAHQTRLVTQKQVTVQVVYVVDENQKNQYSDGLNTASASDLSKHQSPSELLNINTSLKKSKLSVLTETKPQALATSPKKSVKSRRPKSTSCQADSFEQADRILWQARCLAEEWRGSFKAHLRFGDVASELREVVESEAATLLFLGCNSVSHPIIQQLGTHFPCSVLGIPTGLNSDLR